METRKEGDGAIVRRRHECGNLHRFITYQMHESVVRGVGISEVRKQAETSLRGTALREKAFKRRLRVERLLKQGLAVKDIAAKVEVTDARVRQIRAELEDVALNK